MTLQQALRDASEQRRQADAQVIKDHYLEYHHSLYSTAAIYDNAVILAGFAAFFALWAGIAGDLPKFARLIDVALMGVSLMAYVAVTIGQMLQRQFFLEWKRGALFSAYADDAQRFVEEWDAIGLAYEGQTDRTMQLAIGGFWLSLGSGFAAAVLLSYTALGVAFGWPVLTGR